MLLGGGGGIGVASAVAMGQEGATVVVADIAEDAGYGCGRRRARNAGGDGWATQIDALERGAG